MEIEGIKDHSAWLRKAYLKVANKVSQLFAVYGLLNCLQSNLEKVVN